MIKELKMKKNIILSIIIIITIGIIAGIYFYNREYNNEDIDPIDWCIPGTNLTVTGEAIDQNITTDENIFQVINLTTYKGKEVCQAEYNYSDGSLIQYFTKNNDATFVYKNINGNIINEIEINQTSFGTNSEETNYDDVDYTNYEETNSPEITTGGN